MHEKVERNQKLWEYHLKHPNTGCTKIGRVFGHRNKDNKQVPLSPSAVWRIIKRMEKRQKDSAAFEKAIQEATKDESIKNRAFTGGSFVVGCVKEST